MNKTEQLLIRACKSGNPRRRLESVYRRQYLAQPHGIRGSDLCCVLIPICEQYCNVRLGAVLMSLDPSSRYFPNEVPRDYLDNAADALIDIIRFTRGSEFTGLTLPGRFRNRPL
jgi:hypothetical protein